MKRLSCILMIITFLFSSGGQMFGQEKVAISTGFGLPEALNIGLRYQILDQAKIGLSVGWWENEISLSGDYYYHFSGSSKFSDIHPWYGRIGLNCIPNWWTNSYLRIGRDFNLSKYIGISIDAGLMYNFIYRKHGLHPLITTYGVSLFYRF
jgi:hypothetical protein